ncbi:hypothetical protein B7463_g10848, partial [Scytalidium lignicola]
MGSMAALLLLATIVVGSPILETSNSTRSSNSTATSHSTRISSSQPSSTPLTGNARLHGIQFANALFTNGNVVADDSSLCSASNPCPEGCCTQFGFCGYGPDFCGSACIPEASQNSTCAQKSQCDPGVYPGYGTIWGSEYALSESCPLQVCCSQFGFCGTTTDFCGTATVAEPSCSGTSSFGRAIGYYEGWSTTRPCDQMAPEDIPIGAYTHLNYAFLSIDPNSFEIVPASSEEEPLYSRFTALKNLKPGLKTWLSIGGWSFNDPGPTQTTFSQLAASSSAQATFFSSLLSFMSTHGFDGVDLDWEYPVTSDRDGSPADYPNLVTFMKSLRAQLSGHGYGLSMTLPSSYWYMQNFDIVNLAPSLDWFNVMTYDLHGTWDAGDPFIGNVMLAHTNLTEIRQTMDLLWRNNIDPSQVSMGYGFYGRSFTASDPSCLETGCPFSAGGNPGACTQSAGTLSYTEIEAILADPSRNAKITLDPVAAVQIVTFDSNQWVSFDNAETIELKQAYANGECIGGSMVWAVSQDNSGDAAGFLSNSSDLFPGGKGNNSPGNVYVPPSIWDNLDPSVACNPPCTFILPPPQLSGPTVLSWPPVTTGILSSSAGVIVTVTTVISVAPFTISEVPLWPVTIASMDTSGATFIPTQSVIPPAITLTLPGTEALPPLTSFQYTIPSQSDGGSPTSNGAAPTPVQTPSPVQPGIVDGCSNFYQAVSGDTCNEVAVRFRISNDDFYSWNPAIGGSSCSGLWLGYYYCVGGPSSASSGPGPGGPGQTSGGPGPSPSFGSSSHVVTIQPNPTVSYNFPGITPAPISYGPGNPPNSGGCGPEGGNGCGTADCSLFGCGGDCGLFGCDGGCGISFCGGGCGLFGCGPGCGSGGCDIPGGGGGVPPGGFPPGGGPPGGGVPPGGFPPGGGPPGGVLPPDDPADDDCDDPATATVCAAQCFQGGSGGCSSSCTTFVGCTDTDSESIDIKTLAPFNTISDGEAFPTTIDTGAALSSEASSVAARFSTLFPTATAAPQPSCPLGKPDTNDCAGLINQIGKSTTTEIPGSSTCFDKVVNGVQSHWCDYYTQGTCQVSISYNFPLGNPLLPPPTEAQLESIVDKIFSANGVTCNGSGSSTQAIGNALPFTVCLNQVGFDCLIWKQSFLTITYAAHDLGECNASIITPMMLIVINVDGK